MVGADRDWVAVRSVLASTDPIPAYGGIAISRGALEGMAESLNSGTIPMTANHDSRQGIRARNAVAGVREKSSGAFELFMSFEVHPDDWEKYGHLPGMSHTAIEAIRVDEVAQSSIVASFSADAAWFDDGVIVSASRAVQSAIGQNSAIENPGVLPSRVYQFSIVPDARIIIETSLVLFVALGPNLVASAIWDGLKLAYARRRIPKGGKASAKTTVEIKIDNGQSSITACVNTDDSAVAKEALQVFGDAVSKFSFPETGKRVLAWTSDAKDGGGEWKEIQ